MWLVEMTECMSNPELIKEKWLDRVDKTLFINRVLARSYPVLNILSAEGRVIPDPGGGYQAPFTVNPPTP